jgi:transcription initiation factor TFIIE subunit alpha
MRVSNKTIDEVIKEIAGEDVIPLVNLIKKKKNISEFKIAEMMNVNVNVVRNMLYRLYHNNLVSFVRKKDKKKGWYIYYWTFNMKRIGGLLEDIKRKKIDKLQERLEREKNNFFFSCPNNCIRLDFEKAMDYGFKCPECGSLMLQEDNVKKIREIEDEIEKLTGNIKIKKTGKIKK